MRRKGRKRVAPKAKGGAQLTKRRGRRIRKGFLYLTICGIITAVLVYSPVFTLRNIEMKGAVYLTEDDIVTITQIQKGDPLLKMKTDVMQKNLMKDLRIESAVVKRHLPGTIEIDLVERKPVATVACDYGYLDFDRNGKVLMGYQEIKKMQIPFITGTVMHDLYIGDDNKDPVVGKVLLFLSQLDESVRSQISEVNVQNPQAIMAYTTDVIQIRLGDLSRVNEEAALTNDFVDSLKDSHHAIEFVDFGYEAPFIRLRNF